MSTSEIHTPITAEELAHAFEEEDARRGPLASTPSRTG